MAYAALLLGVVQREAPSKPALDSFSSDVMPSLCRLARFPEQRFAEVRAAVESSFASLFLPGDKTGVLSPWARTVAICRSYGIVLPFVTDLNFQLHVLEVSCRLQRTSKALAAPGSAA